MDLLKKYGPFSFITYLVFGLPVSLAIAWATGSGLFWRDALIAWWVAMASSLGTCSAAFLCTAFARNLRYPIIDLVAHGVAAGILASVVATIFLRRIGYYTGVETWPLLVAAPAAFLHVFICHFIFNRAQTPS